MTQRIINFNPGPCALPLPALQTAQAELLDFQGTGMSIMEISHRSKEYEAVHNEAKSLILEHLGFDAAEWDVLFLGGGAHLQFFMVPYNFLGDGRKADYVNTGTWSKGAIKEARLLFPEAIREAASTEADRFDHVPRWEEIEVDPQAAYVHLTSNNTIFGTQWPTLPTKSPVPVFVDMSSDFLARRIDGQAIDLIYAGAQKNAGPAGVTIVVLRKGAVERCRKGISAMLSYKTHLDANSLYNTPPCFSIYMVRNVMRWIRDSGGIDAIEAANRKKGELLYGCLDRNPGFFKPHARPDSRSLMNVTFRLPSEEFEAKLIADAKKAGFQGLKGHRSVGGIRVSMYNAISVANIEALVSFLEEFARTV
ncbi:MAG: 3-phosphoserine/phosphohydroxythreonine transaminase [Myxococcota bacterium]|jgi:phosphoserine aminotransferase|nr:3-phosphoserine/phosphohydroxythreonine transaminase [Myxococcota bacterium]